MKRVFVKPKKNTLVRKSQQEQYKPYDSNGEEVNLTKEVSRYIKFGDLIELKRKPLSKRA